MVQDAVAGGSAVYAELVIRLTHDLGRLWRVELASTQPGSSASTERTGRALLDLDALRDVQNDMDEYGRRLTEALFADEAVREGFRLAAALAGAQQLRVRLYIDSDVAAVHAVRWETLRTPEGTALATGDRVLFSRYLRSPDWRRVPLVTERDLRALVVIANPSNLSSFAPEGAPLEPINVADELERTRRALGSIPITAYSEPGTATLEHLVQGIREGHNIVYLVCHGSIVAGETRLYLERSSGETTTVTGEELAAEFAQLRQVPSLVVLASCQSAGSGSSGALSAVGPLLARVGVPSVLAMQDRVSMRTSAQFAETFFTELTRDGRLDRAAAVARTRVKSEPDYWVPVLFSRLSNGCLWPPPTEGPAEFEQWPAVLSHIKRGSCIPIVGPGLLEFLLGPTREMAQRWADTYHFPMSPDERQDLPQVAQFLAVNQSDPGFPADELGRYIRREVVERYGEVLTPGQDDDTDDRVGELISQVGRHQRAKNPTDPHAVLARLPFPIYVTANPDSLLTDALVEAGKQPVVEVGHWNDQVDQPESIWDVEPTYKPSLERPLVYHVFGHVRDRQTVVLTEDNFFDFLLHVNRGEWKIPETVAAALSKNALLFLGFQTDEWGFSRSLQDDHEPARPKPGRPQTARCGPDRSGRGQQSGSAPRQKVPRTVLRGRAHQ